MDRLATASVIRWCGDVLRRNDDGILRVARDLKMGGKRKRGQPKKTWKKQVKKEAKKIGLKKEDVLNREKWRDGVRAYVERCQFGHLC